VHVGRRDGVGAHVTLQLVDATQVQVLALLEHGDLLLELRDPAIGRPPVCRRVR